MTLSKNALRAARITTTLAGAVLFAAAGSALAQAEPTGNPAIDQARATCATQGFAYVAVAQITNVPYCTQANAAAPGFLVYPTN